VSPLESVEHEAAVLGADHLTEGIGYRLRGERTAGQEKLFRFLADRTVGGQLQSGVLSLDGALIEAGGLLNLWYESAESY